MWVTLIGFATSILAKPGKISVSPWEPATTKPSALFSTNTTCFVLLVASRARCRTSQTIAHSWCSNSEGLIFSNLRA